jgi:hypothetical protein
MRNLLLPGDARREIISENKSLRKDNFSKHQTIGKKNNFGE